MAEITIRCRRNGPLVIEGPIRVVDADGNPWPLDPARPNVALCRCGHSARKPFCDGSHNRVGFSAGETAPPAGGTP